MGTRGGQGGGGGCSERVCSLEPCWRLQIPDALARERIGSPCTLAHLYPFQVTAGSIHGEQQEE